MCIRMPLDNDIIWYANPVRIAAAEKLTAQRCVFYAKENMAHLNEKLFESEPNQEVLSPELQPYLR